MQAVFDALRLQVLQRDWLSSNNIVFTDPDDLGVAVVDTGYATHAQQTVALLEHASGGRPLTRILCTHLHSDHCGGNAALQVRWPGVRTWVPQRAWDKAHDWNEDQLTYRLTRQRCDRFRVDHRLRPGTTIELGGHHWHIHGTPGHDDDAVVLFEPTQRVLISGDALWRHKVAVIFPELEGEPGFEPALQTLDLIESLDPAIVIPGHGAAFTEVQDALSISRRRLTKLQSQPAEHARHSLRVLMVFHLMEHRQRKRQAVCDWMSGSPLAQRPRIQALMGLEPAVLAPRILDSLIDDGVVIPSGEDVMLA